MTNREYLIKRFRWWAILPQGLLVLIFTGTLFRTRYLVEMHVVASLLWCLALAAAGSMISWFLVGSVAFRCPRCGYRLWPMRKAIIDGSTICTCPNCGLNMDDSRDNATR
jgi:uncharacterized C2H2 Zn-finger protein